MAPTRIKHSPTKSEFNIVDTHWGWEVEAFKDGKGIGSLKIAYVGEYGDEADWKELPCADQIEHIAYHLDSIDYEWITPGEIYEVKEAWLDPEYRGTGIGKALYETALRFLPTDGDLPNILMANVCVTGETSEMAQGVWQSLGKQYIGGGGGSYDQPWGGVISAVKSLYPFQE